MRGLVFAHAGEPLAPHDLWSAWSFELPVLLALLLALLPYLAGVLRLWRQAGLGHGVTVQAFLAYLGDVYALFVALVSPLDALSSTLFSAHMVQHLVLVLLAAPLLILGRPAVALLWLLPRRDARGLARSVRRVTPLSRAWHALAHPVSAWLLFAAAMWGWHLPVLYQAALRSEALHALEHGTFLLTALLFWWVLLGAGGSRAARYGVAVLYLFTTVLQTGALGALMTFASRPWYPYYNDLAAAWGLTAIQDQQLAGLIMWIPGGGVFTLLTITYFAAWLRSFEQRPPFSSHPDGSIKS